MKRLLPLIPLLLLAACGAGPDASGASAEEAQQLNDAAAAMDVNATAPDDDASSDQGNAQ